MTELLPCPFCGRKASIVQHDFPGSWGPNVPAIYIGCSGHPTKCFVRTERIATEQWQGGRGTFSVLEEVTSKLAAAWNTRHKETEV